MIIDLLSVAIGIGLGTIFLPVCLALVKYALKNQRERDKQKWAKELWRLARNASFLNNNNDNKLKK